jgi:hypothetical protein
MEDLMKQLNALLPRGDFDGFAKEHLGLSRPTARRYLKGR